MGGRGSGSGMIGGGIGAFTKRVSVLGPATPSPKQAAERLHLSSIFDADERGFTDSVGELTDNGIRRLATEIGANVNSSMNRNQVMAATINRRRNILSQVSGDTITVTKLKRLMRR